MEKLPNGLTLEIPEGAFPLSTDSMLLAHFVKLPRNAQVLDLGSGCGTLGLLLCASHSDCQVTGFELDPLAHRAAEENIRRNDLTSRLKSICADLREIPRVLTPGSFQCCVSNPPYFPGGPASSRFPLARGEEQCSLSQLLNAAAWALKYGGDLFLVHRPERLGEIIALSSRHQLEAKRLCLVRHGPQMPVNLILIQLRKGAKPGMKWEELILHHADGSPTDAYKSIYHI